MASIHTFIEQARERHMWHALIGYPFLVWIVQQATGFLIDHQGLDPRWMTAGLIAALALLPGAVLWNWRHGGNDMRSIGRGEMFAYGLSLVMAVAAANIYWNLAPAPEMVAPMASETGRGVTMSSPTQPQPAVNAALVESRGA